MCAALPRLLDARPDLVAQLAPGLNDDALVAKVTLGSQRKLWWQHLPAGTAKCGHIHLWQAQVADRVKRKSRCPVCAGQRPCRPDCDSLAAVHPDIVAAEWNVDANLPLTPEQLRPHSGVLVRWECIKHSPPYRWTACPNSHFGRNTGCPACYRLRRGKLRG